MNNGLLIEQKVLYLASKLDIIVSLPFGGQERYDQVWDVNGKLYKIQVKQSRLVNNGSQLSFSCQASTNYDNGEIDGIVTEYDDMLFFIPYDELNKSSNKRLTLFLNDSIAMNKHQLNFAEDYLIEKQFNLK